MRKVLVALLAITLTTSLASAGAMSIDVGPTAPTSDSCMTAWGPPPAYTPVMADMVVNQLMASSALNFSQAQMIITLTSGTIHNLDLAYNMAMGDPDVDYDDGLSGKPPSFTEYGADTFIKAAAGKPSAIAGAAINLPGSSGVKTWTSTAIDIAWGDVAGGTGVYDLGKVVLSPDATGTWSILLMDETDAYITLVDQPIVAGDMQDIPEPASLALLGLGTLALIRRR
jgi:hypothetical protein